MLQDGEGNGGPRKSEAWPREVRAGLFLAGIFVLVVIFWRAGWPAIQANLRAIGWWFVLLTALYALPQLAWSIGWWSVLEPRGAVSLLPLFGLYTAGDAINYFGPLGIAGEPVKVHMLRDALGTGPAVASLTLHKHANLIAQCVFGALGITLSILLFPLTPLARGLAVLGALFLACLLALMTWGLKRGLAPVVRRLAGCRSVGARLARLEPQAIALDEQIQGFYRKRRGRFLAAIGWCLLGWFGRVLETYLVLRLLAPGSGLPLAFGVEALAMVFGTAFLAVPAGVGSSEGVRVGVFVLFGLAAASGVAYGLARRARELVWALLGGFILLTWRRAH